MTQQIMEEPSAAMQDLFSGQNIHDLESFTPGTLKLIKRNGKVVPYDDNKIKVAITKAFLHVEGGSASASTRIHEIVNRVTNQITKYFKSINPEGGVIHIEDVQDVVQNTLMQAREYKVASAYVLYREERRKMRAKERMKLHGKIEQAGTSLINVTLLDGSKEPLDIHRMHTVVEEACENLNDVTPEVILKEAQRNLYDGVPINDVDKSLVMTARTLIEKEPNHSYVAARLLLDACRSEALRYLGMQESATFHQMETLYPSYFATYIDKGIELGILDPRLKEFDLKKLGEALIPERDLKFTYLSIQTLYDRYFIHHDGQRYELPQAFFMRVAMGLALNEKDKEHWAIQFYKLLSSFDYMSSTPTLFNSGTVRPQLSSCYLTTVPDDLDGIFTSIRDNAMLSKFAGGLGNDWTPVRGIGAHIKGTNGKSLGVVPFLNVADATAIAVNQGGKRKGATCAYLETWHIDIEEFLELRKNTGDDRRRTHDMNTANWVPDLFMERVFEEKEWTLFSPDEVPDLHDSFGAEFKKRYEAYEALAQEGKIKNFKKIPAITLWRKMLGLLFETGHPWITFKDPCNLRSPQQHIGVVHSSNLCTEITLNTSKDEVAVCNLGSINLPAHIKDNGIDTHKLKHTVDVALRMLDNVIDINYYPVQQARNSNLRHRPVGLGLMGFQDALYKLGIDYQSDKAVEFADISMEQISYFAIQASSELAQERGTYESYPGSLWSQGTLPIDSIKFLQESRGQYLEQDTSQTLDWDKVRQQVMQHGMRNSNVMAIAPTATIANICGITQSIEPTYQNLYVKSNLSGEFTVINLYLVNELKNLGLWDEVMVNDLKYYNGSVSDIDRIPEELRKRFATAFEIHPKWLVEAASRRIKWLDQAQSLNLYVAQPSGKKIDMIYRMAWLRGLKTTYYLRSLGATSPEKSTIHDNALNAVSVTPQVCSIDDPDCEACQ